MSEHRFRLGPKLQFNRGCHHRSAPDGFFEVIRQLLDTHGEPYYQIKSPHAPHERVIKENDIQKT
jgi:hypothetical protein